MSPVTNQIMPHAKLPPIQTPKPSNDEAGTFSLLGPLTRKYGTDITSLNISMQNTPASGTKIYRPKFISLLSQKCSTREKTSIAIIRAGMVPKKRKYEQQPTIGIGTKGHDYYKRKPE
jgi:hypothetical protein